ncbi:uncharacterized protein Dwil_GK26765 [Drosophila willistoni]|uniref:Uncharacterized protein n=1 Tax=Drosophila willistoni TaxID=7260 RepID=A0A0Q9X3L3_DROWI|nr:uncharacterized protein Dwil_GK26765 [Drosophila willistoni]
MCYYSTNQQHAEIKAAPKCKRKPLILMLFAASLLFLSQPAPTDAVIEDVLDVIHVVKEVTTGILKAWDIVQSSPLAANIEFPLMREKQRKVLQRLKEVSRQIDQTEQQHAEYVALAIDSVTSYMNQNGPVIAKMNDITDTINRISSRYEQMKSYEPHQDKLEMATLIQFAEWTVSPNAHSVQHLMDRLHLTLLGGEDKINTSSNLLYQLASNYEVNMYITLMRITQQLRLLLFPRDDEHE